MSLLLIVLGGILVIGAGAVLCQLLKDEVLQRSLEPTDHHRSK